MNSIKKITCKRVLDSIVPARVIAYRKNGSPVVAGDKFLRPALITLFTLITGEQLLPKEIRQLVKKHHVRVSKEVREVL